MFSQEPDPSSPLGRLALRARRVPAWIRAIVLGLAFAATLLCVIADVGPYRAVADAQASLMDGEHYPVLSFGLTFACFGMPAGALIHLLAGRYPELPQPPNPFGPGPFAGRSFPQGPSPYDPQSPYWQGPGAGPAHAPPGQGHVPSGQGYVPSGQGYAPSGQGYAPSGQGYAPPGQGHVPPGQGYTPPGQPPRA